MPSAARRRRPPQRTIADQATVDALSGAGYSGICMRGGRICAVKGFVFTTAIVVGLDLIGYERRYCYEHDADARAALDRWDGDGHPTGPWIKCKSAGGELLNAQWARSN